MAPRLIRLPAMPTRSIIVTAKSIESGMAEATISPARRLPEEREQHGDDEDRPLEAGSARRS